MSIKITKYPIAKLNENTYSNRKPVFTLFTWNQCSACPRFLEKLKEVLVKNKLKVQIQQVIFDDDMDRIAKEVTSFPRLRKTFQGKQSTFDLSLASNDIDKNLLVFLTQ